MLTFQTALMALSDDDPAREDLLLCRLVIAAEALNAEADEPTVQAVGMLSSFTMQEVRTVVAEFRADDDEWERETRKAHSHSLSSR